MIRVEPFHGEDMLNDWRKRHPNAIILSVEWAVVAHVGYTPGPGQVTYEEPEEEP